jgi:hypothetical protein
MPAKTANPWKTVAIVLGVLLAVTLIGFGLVVAGVTKLGLSLL